MSTGYQKPPDIFNRVKRLEKARRRSRDIITEYDPDERPGPVPNVVLGFKVREQRTLLTYSAMVSWGMFAPGTCQADVAAYQIHLEPCNAAGVRKEVGRRQNEYFEIKNWQDIEEDDLKQSFQDIEHPKKWYYHARVRVIDEARRKGEWSGWTGPALAPDIALPKPPTPTGVALNFDRHRKHRWDPHDAVVTLNEVGPWDYPGPDPQRDDTATDKPAGKWDQDDVAHYAIQLARVNPLIVEDLGTNKYQQIGEPDRDWVPAKDQDPNSFVRKRFHKVKRRHWYQARARSIDRFERKSDWSNWTLIGSPSDTDAPPRPKHPYTGVSGDIHADYDNHKLFLLWDSPEDLDDTDSDLKDPDPDIAYFQVQASNTSDAGTRWNSGNIIFKDRYVEGHSKTFKLKKPTGTYYGRARAVDGSGNKSAWSYGTAASGFPPQPAKPAIENADFIAYGKRDNRMRVVLKFNYDADAYVDDKISEYKVELQESTNNTFNDTDDVRRQGVRDPSGEGAQGRRVTFLKIHADFYYRFRYKAIDSYERGSPWSPWSDSIQAPDVDGVPLPTALTGDADNHEIHLRWDSPVQASDNSDPKVPDWRIAHYQCEVSLTADAGTRWATGNLYRKDHMVQGHSKTFQSRKITGTVYFRCRAVNHDSKKGTWVETTAIKGAPTVPFAAPLITFQKNKDAQKNQKTDALVKFWYTSDGLSSGTDLSGTYGDAEIDFFQIQFKVGSNAPVTNDVHTRDQRRANYEGKVQYVEEYQGVKKNRYCTTRYRAVDTRGHKSPWSAWR